MGVEGVDGRSPQHATVIRHHTITLLRGGGNDQVDDISTQQSRRFFFFRRNTKEKVPPTTTTTNTPFPLPDGDFSLMPSDDENNNLVLRIKPKKKSTTNQLISNILEAFPSYLDRIIPNNNNNYTDNETETKDMEDNDNDDDTQIEMKWTEDTTVLPVATRVKESPSSSLSISSFEQHKKKRQEKVVQQVVPAAIVATKNNATKATATASSMTSSSWRMERKKQHEPPPPTENLTVSNHHSNRTTYNETTKIIEPLLRTTTTTTTTNESDTKQLLVTAPAESNLTLANFSTSTARLILPVSSYPPHGIIHHHPLTNKESSLYISSGLWNPIDNIVSLGMASRYDSWKLSRNTRGIRKWAAKTTGMHGLLSGKGRRTDTLLLQQQQNRINATQSAEQIQAMRQRLVAIDRARKSAEKVSQDPNVRKRRWTLFRRTASRTGGNSDLSFVFHRDDHSRKERVKEIDKLIKEGQQHLQSLIAEKDVLQRRPSPLWNYSSTLSETAASSHNTTTRRFSFPPDSLVEEYLEVLLSGRRLVKLNHTELWRTDGDELDGLDDDELLDIEQKRRVLDEEDDVSGSWFLRYGLGEKIGEAAETSAYKAVTKSVMGVLAKSLSALHGINIMEYSDIRLFMEQSPDLPSGIGRAQESLTEIMKRGSKRSRSSRSGQATSDNFIQRDAVVETLISHCQISAPLLKLFPLAWQRAMLGNIITLVTAIISDFCEGLEFQILGHRLTCSFTPITEQDLLYRARSFETSFRQRRSKSREFEAAVRATAEAIDENMKILDRWHERALGARKLQSQLATLIARLVLTLADDVLSGARMDLWTVQAGGPRLIAGLEYRTTPSYMGDPTDSYSKSPSS